MTWTLPTWYGLLLVSLAAFRTWRLIARDTILDWPRNWLVGLPVRWQEDDPVPDGYREHLAIFLECMWCAGFWVSIVWWVAFEVTPHWTTIAAVPFAVSALVALAAKNLD